jgi:hypothetical protein
MRTLPETITRTRDGRTEKFKGYVYHNHGSTWTGWIQQLGGGGSWKFISRAGYETKESAERYVMRWLDKLKAKDEAKPLPPR